MSKTKRYIFIVLASLLIIGLVIIYSYTLKEDELGVSATERMLLLRAAQDPFVLHVRSAINNYNSGSQEGISSVVDFSNYREYLKGKFALMEINNSALGGGKEMAIIFLDKPDALFYAWVYRQGDGGYELRAFHSYEDITAGQAKSMYESVSPILRKYNLAL